jgi:probable H4MPT-linked C1 transfer pathway protein
VLGQGVLIDIGSTTTDLIAFRDGRVATASRSDRDRLASGELAYQGVVRTPLCALTPHIVLQDQRLNVMNECFATTADVYRLTGELDAAHDAQPSADNAPKTLAATRRRLARMVGCDLGDANEAEWLAFARQWRAAQLDLLADSLARVMQEHRQAADPPWTVVSAGCGDFLVPELLQQVLGNAAASTRQRRYGDDVARVAMSPQARPLRLWTQVCAPSVAVASLLDGAHR